MNKTTAYAGHRVQLASTGDVLGGEAAAGMATASNEDPDFPESEGLFDALCDAAADNVDGMVIGAIAGAAFLAVLFVFG